ncbi:MAG: 50S ribosomal protein L24 [Gammaproteobacteria bacterium]|nr:50S ribosomal protein L24 [Gammaproteobacteria bacterium]
MRKIKQGDDVIVIAGKDKGRRGRVERVVGDDRVIVDGINMIKKHTKGNPSAGDPGGIIEREAPLDISNVAMFNPKSKKADRVGFRMEGDKKVRFFKSDNEVVDS